MSASLRLETLSAGAADTAVSDRLAALDALLAAAEHADGQPAFNDQTRLETRAGTNHVVLGFEGDSLVAAAAVADDTLELVVAPDARGRGLGGHLADHVLTSRTGPLLLRVLEPFVGALPAPTLAWAHGDHPAARRLAARHGFEPVRRLLQLRMPLAAHYDESTIPLRIGSFVPGRDDEAWVELNARVFASHPEQGGWTIDDLRARLAEPWFDADDFLVARDETEGIVGYNWLKIEPGSDVGEIYVLGVDAERAGRGVGRALTQRGLNRMVARGCTTAALYVEEDNGPAVPLYRSLGFTDHTVDVQYAKK